MADKVYIPNLVINEISEDLINHVADQVGNKLTIDPSNLAKLDTNNQFTGENTFDIVPKSNGTPANDTDLVTKSYVDSVVVGGGGGSVDTSNLAKLDQENTFTQRNTIPTINTGSIYSANTLNVVSDVGVDITAHGSNGYRQILMNDIYGVQIASRDANHVSQVIAYTSGAGIQFNEKAIAIGHDGNDMNTPAEIRISHTPTITNPTEWATMTDNEVPTKKQILDNIQGGNVDTTNLAKLDQGNTFTGTQIFNGMISFNQEVSVGDIKFYGNNNFYSNSIFGGPVVITNQQPNQDFSIGPALNGVSINLGDNCTLQMNAKMISELKRLLGIQ